MLNSILDTASIRLLFNRTNALVCVCMYSIMDSLISSSSSSSFRSPFHRQPRIPTNTLPKPLSKIPSCHRITPHILRSNFKTLPAVSPAPAETESAAPEEASEAERFEWYEQWYPVWAVCDLDKRRPHAKKVMGIDLVVWWDRNENAWKVFDDSCPHRLAPLSEGRIDQWGRLQCVYHGWCFGGAGDCKFIPQAPRDGPPVSSVPILVIFV